MGTPTATASFDLDAGWTLHPQVALRPERFGALLYHYGNRRLSFLKDVRLVRVVEGLAEQDCARQALQAAGVGAGELARFTDALATLAASGLLVPRSAQP